MRALLVSIALAGVVLCACDRRDDDAAAVPAVVTPSTSGAETPPAVAATLPAKPLFKFTPREIDAYLRQLSRDEPDLRRRIVHLARANLRQPYELYLLGEAPFETIDAQPVYCLEQSDCVVFAEHTLAMALSDSWPQFLTMLQRIRYDGGRIGVRTRNHYTEADWNRNNAWLVRDITDEVGGAHVVRFKQRVDRARFFRDRYKLETDIPPETIEESFIPYEQIESVKSQLMDGDIVNFVSGKGEGYWVGHVGLVARTREGRVKLIHSASPAVREEPIDDYIRRAAPGAADLAGEKAGFRGFKFLRVHDDALARLAATDGPGATRVVVPENSPLTWERYLATFDPGR